MKRLRVDTPYGQVSVMIYDNRECVITAPDFCYATKHGGSEYSIESRFAPESAEEDALIDMCQELHRKCLKEAKIG